jgi:hypothetical protein
MPEYIERPWTAPHKTVKLSDNHVHQVPEHGKLYTHTACGANRIVDVQRHDRWHQNQKT